MFIERLLNQGNAPLIEQAVRVLRRAAEAARRERGQRRSRRATCRRICRSRSSGRCFTSVSERRQSAAPGIDAVSMTSWASWKTRRDNILFHDRNNRSMEQLMSRRREERACITT